MNAMKPILLPWYVLSVLFLPQSAGIAQGIGPDAAPDSDIPEGYWLFEEDILLPVGRATYATALWPGGVLPFQFDGNVTTANQQLMLNAMTAWEAAANVSFVPRNGESNYLHIFDGTLNFSEGVGMAGGQHDISIVSWGSFGVLAHELGHALGFWHEQSRSDRDNFVQINWDNISQTGCGGSCDSQFEIRGSGGEYGPYDFDSVMHYRACSFSCCAAEAQCSIVICAPTMQTCRTITVLPPFDVAWQNNIGQRTHLSFFDQRTMSFLYPMPDWRFLEQGADGSDDGTFHDPYQTLSRALSQTPAGDTLWFLEPAVFAAAGTYSRPMTWRVGYGTVTLGN